MSIRFRNIEQSQIVVKIGIILITCFSQASGDSWNRLGKLEGGIVTDVAHAPSQPNVLYAAIFGDRVYKSTDAGSIWHRVSEGITYPIVNDVAVDPQDANIVYAGTDGCSEETGLYKSTDGGITWIRKELGGLTKYGIQAIAIDPENCNIIYAAYQYFIGGSKIMGIQKSINSGETWEDISQDVAWPDIHDIEVSPLDSNLVYVGTYRGLYRTTTGGESWETVGIPLSVRDIATYPSNPSIMYVATDGGAGVYKSSDTGFTWVGIGSGGVSDKNVAAVGVSPVDSNRIYAGLWLAWGGGIYKTTNGGSSWENCPTKFERVIYSIDIPSESSIVVGAGGGILRSIDSGNTWEASNNGLTAVLVTDLYATGTALCAATFFNGIFVYPFDADSEWIELGLYDRFIESVLSNSDSVIYAGISHYFVPDTASLYKSINGGLSWSASDSGIDVPEIIEEMPVFSLEFHPQDSSTIFCGSLNGVYKTTSAGESWTYTFGDEPYVSLCIFDIAIDPTNYGKIYICGEGGYFDGQIYVSADTGNTWELLWSTLYPPGAGDGVCTSMDIHPTGPETLYVGVGSAWTHGVFKSTNSGEDWFEVLGGSLHPWVESVIINPSKPDIVYAGLRWWGTKGIYRTTDGGNNWEEINEGIITPNITSLTINPNDHRLVYAGTYGSGVFFYVDSLAQGIDEPSLNGNFQKCLKLWCHPNPFTETAKIIYRVPYKTRIKIEVFNLLGQRVKSLVDEHRLPGRYFTRWNGKNEKGKDVDSGVYFVRLSDGKSAFVQKTVLLRTGRR